MGGPIVRIIVFCVSILGSPHFGKLPYVCQLRIYWQKASYFAAITTKYTVDGGNLAPP